MLTIFDIEYLLLPKTLCYLGIIVGLITISFIKLSITGQYYINSVIQDNFFAALIGFILFRAFYLITKLILGKPAIGVGDGNLIAMLGAWLGLNGLGLSVMISILLGGIYCTFGLIRRTINRGDVIAYGPFLSLGGVLVWTFGNEFIINMLI